MRYRRANATGATWFFTVNLVDRKSDLLIRHIDTLHEAVRLTRRNHPFAIVVMVVLPDHLYAVRTLPARANRSFMRAIKMLHFLLSAEFTPGTSKENTC